MSRSSNSALTLWSASPESMSRRGGCIRHPRVGGEARDGHGGGHALQVQAEGGIALAEVGVVPLHLEGVVVPVLHLAAETLAEVQHQLAVFLHDAEPAVEVGALGAGISREGQGS